MIFINNFYVYRHIRLDSNTTFYIGKGTELRAYDKKTRNYYHENIIKKYGYRIEIILANLNEKEAFEVEKYFIKLYKLYGLCEANFTDGGTGGNTVKYRTEEQNRKTKEKRSKSMMGLIRGPQSQDHRRKQSESKKGRPSYFRTQEHKEKQSKILKGKLKRAQTKQERINKAVSHGSKPFLVWEAEYIKHPSRGIKAKYKKGRFVGEWINKEECGRYLKINASRIGSCLNYPNKFKYNRGYIFKYKEIT